MATATFSGTQFALQDASPVVLSTVPQSKYVGGKIEVASDVVFASGSDLDAGSTMKVGKLPAGAVVKQITIYPIASATFGAPDAMANAVTGSLGIAGDTDLFGDVTALNATTIQTVAPKPDGTTYTSLTDFVLKADVDVLFTTAGAALTAAEGIAVSIFYSMG